MKNKANGNQPSVDHSHIRNIILLLETGKKIPNMDKSYTAYIKK